MRLTSYTLTLGETINLGNYSNFRYEVSGTINLDGDVTNDEQRDEEIAELKEFLRAKARDIRGRNQPQPEPEPETP